MFHALFIQIHLDSDSVDNAESDSFGDGDDEADREVDELLSNSLGSDNCHEKEDDFDYTDEKKASNKSKCYISPCLKCQTYQ